ncbi:MAG: TerB family tellurite resistance protein [Gemmatimonadales bacterium]
MLDAIRRFVTSRMTPAAAGSQPAEAPSGPDAIQLAACALLLELAHADAEFSAAERSHIESAVQRHFGLDAATARELIALADAERLEAVDHYQFARTITQQYDLGQKMVLAEVMWGVILADGEIRRHESYLVRKLANLLDLAPAYLAQARRAAAPEP